ncbi:MAG: exodeoxyribonuclease V subunit alpha [Syntrophales bacterium]|jgi:exodeoxyribonuclease V alpha subunit
MSTIDPNLNNKYFSDLDIHFARFMGRLSGGHAPEVMLAVAMVSRFTREGNICLDLRSVEGTLLHGDKDGQDAMVLPALARWSAALEGCKVVGSPGDYKPLILDNRSRLYLYRYWDYERTLADFIKGRIRGIEDKNSGRDPGEANTALFRESLSRLFPAMSDGDTDWAKIAAVTAFLKRFAVIAGSPGTGKTTIVVKVLALLLEQFKGKELRIALAAPTGKAAFRLQDSIRKNKEGLASQDDIKAAIPDNATTIHRLLGNLRNSPYFRHNERNRLPFNLVVVDEASMVDLPLMSKLVQAMPKEARLILLGDRDQLSSVEAGAVLGDICGIGEARPYSSAFIGTMKAITGDDLAGSDTVSMPGMQDCIAGLKKNYRFEKDTGISRACNEVNAGNSQGAMSILRSDAYEDISWSDIDRPAALISAVRKIINKKFNNYLQATKLHDNSEHALSFFEEFRILCAVRQGPFGVVVVNRVIETILTEANLIKPEGQWYGGRPIMVTRNDYNLRLFNGDVGIILPDHGQRDELRAFFRDAGGNIRKFPPVMLPEHETVFAMTVHKSQGSEFKSVLFILPDYDSPVLTRELIYTGITRAKKRVEIWGTEGIFRAAVSRRIMRTSGLYDALYS